MKLPVGGYCESATGKLMEDAWNKWGDTKAIEEANSENEVVSGYELRERWGRRHWDGKTFVWVNNKSFWIVNFGFSSLRHKNIRFTRGNIFEKTHEFPFP